ncbi:pyridoxal phosphate-dependent transferase [Sporodiniella umbellata]|nr:pyridoxal phosphate-dependent transferase [Sporodiniella umbellata]
MVCNEQNETQVLDILLSEMKTLILDYVQKGQEKSVPVVLSRSPSELYKLFDFELPQKGAGVQGTLALIKATLKYSVNSWNPKFIDKLYAGTNPIGVISELLLGVLNSNVHVYHVSPVLSLMEIEVTKAVGRLLGMGENSGGLLCPGGSASNLLAMTTARNRLFPSIKKEGYFPRPFPNASYGKLKVFTSIDSHYSIDKAVLILGLGLDSIVKVPVDREGRMQAEALEILILESIQANETPFFINATAGTTVLGAFDPIDRLSEIAQKYGCWLHVDGSWGGSAIFSKEVREGEDWFRGSARADTFTLNPHKLLGVPLQCSMLITPHEGHLLFAKANSTRADYLFHGNPYDLGAGSLGCGRRPDALKLFLAWKFYGEQGLGYRVDQALATARAFSALVQSRPGFTTVQQEHSFLQVCFWYVPRGLEKVNKAKITQVLHEKINATGEFLVDRAPLENLPDFFRVVVNMPHLTLRDLERLLDLIEEQAAIVCWDQVCGQSI